MTSESETSLPIFQNGFKLIGVFSSISSTRTAHRKFSNTKSNIHKVLSIVYIYAASKFEKLHSKSTSFLFCNKDRINDCVSDVALQRIV